MILRIISDFFYFTAIAFAGWAKVISNVLNYLYTLWQKNSILIKISLIVFLIQLVFATRPWFEYQIQFNGIDELLQVSSKVNLIFIFLSLVNFILLLSDFSFSILLILALQIIMCILFLFGFQSPTSLHVDFMKDSDYKFHFNFYIFFVANLASLVLSIRLFLKK